MPTLWNQTADSARGTRCVSDAEVKELEAESLIKSTAVCSYSIPIGGPVFSVISSSYVCKFVPSDSLPVQKDQGEIRVRVALRG